MSGRSRKLSRFVGACGAVLVTLTGLAQAQSEGTWIMKTLVPAALSQVSVAYVDGKLHVMGGSVLSVIGPYHLLYDPATDKWNARALVPRPLDHMGAAVLNGKIYLIGGFARSADRNGQDSAFEYDPKLDTWRILAPMKTARGSVGTSHSMARFMLLGVAILAAGRSTRTKSTIP
jgi:N-acetylneuraminic acid mutarotase